MIGELGKYLIRFKPSFPSKNQIFRYLAWNQLKLALDSRQVNCVLDVGANKGQFAEGLRKIGYRGWIISFEPAPDDFAVMAGKLKRDPLWKGRQIALGGEDKETSFNITLDDTRCNSILKPSRCGDEFRTVNVALRRLDSMFDELIAGIEAPRVFLKMDTQGYDLEVIKGSAGCLDRVLGLLSEVAVEPNYEGMPLYLESLKTYEGLGFHLLGVSEIAWNHERGTVAEMECLMIR